MAVGTTASLLSKAAYEMETESNWENFKNGVPANLKTIEGLLYIDPENEDLLSALVKGYAAYGFAVHETLYLKDMLLETDKNFHKNQALMYFTKALNYGKRYLKVNGIEFNSFISNANEKNYTINSLNDELSGDLRDVETVVFMGQALGSLINLQKNRMTLVAQLPITKSLFDWSCSKRPDVANGICDIYYATYESSRPRMLGGNPAKGKKLFLEAIKKYPDNWLVRMSYIQYYLIPMMDEEGYKDQKFFLRSAKKKHETNVIYNGKNSKDSTFAKARLRFYQALAIKRFDIVNKIEKEIF